MSRPVNHIVHKLNLVIDTPDERTARRIYREAGSLLQQYVLPQLEELLRKYDLADNHIRLDSLQVDIGVSKRASVEDVLRESLAAAIAKAVEKKLKESEDSTTRDHMDIAPANGNGTGVAQVVVQNGPQQVTRAFLFFLEKGVLPWWYPALARNVMSTELLTEAIAPQEASFTTLFRHKLAQQPVVLERLLAQAEPSLLVYLYSLLAPLDVFSAASAQYNRWQQPGALKNDDVLTQSLQRYYWISIWKLFPATELEHVVVSGFKEKLQPVALHIEALLQLPEHAAQPAFLKAAPLLIPMDVWRPSLAGDHPGSADNKAPLKLAQAVTSSGATPAPQQPVQAETEEHWLANAGLVLLHPFLQYFFAELGFLDEAGHFNSKENQQTAVHLLHYLATHEEQAPDFDLIMEKYLCGLSAADYTDRFCVLPAHMKEEAGSLLRAVIQHWQALKSTSAEGLQQGFLQRKGKLQLTEQKHSLLLEPYAQDILLDQLPWNISLLKLPWLPQILHVEWITGT